MLKAYDCSASLLSNIVEANEPSVIFGDNSKHNVLSISQFCDEGMNCIFTSSQCFVKNCETNTTLLAGFWKGNVFAVAAQYLLIFWCFNEHLVCIVNWNCPCVSRLLLTECINVFMQFVFLFFNLPYTFCYSLSLAVILTVYSFSCIAYTN